MSTKAGEFQCRSLLLLGFGVQRSSAPGQRTRAKERVFRVRSSVRRRTAYMLTEGDANFRADAAICCSSALSNLGA